MNDGYNHSCRGLARNSMQLHLRPCHDAKSAAGAYEELLQIDSGVILAQSGKIGQHRCLSIGKHNLQAQQIPLDVPVAQQPRATRVGSDHPSEAGIGT